MLPAADPPNPADVYRRPDLTGTGMRYRDQPVTYHGEDFDRVVPGRRVVDVPGRVWPARRPEDCVSTEIGEWITLELLLCEGCGLDCT
jgi:hypothetical protein